MTISKPSRCTALLLSTLSAFSFSVCASFAAKPVVPWSSVRRVANGKHQGVVTTTFVQPDPSFSGQQNLVDNLASFTNTVDQNLSPNSFTGLNIPSYGKGLFPGTGKFLSTEAFYSVPGTSQTDKPDNSLVMVLQTEDGLYHLTSFADNASSPLFTNNGRTNWQMIVFGGLSLAPALTPGAGSVVRKEAIVFSGTPNSKFGSINQILPPAQKTGPANIFIVGDPGQYIVDDPNDAGSKANFSVNTHPDSKFNFEF